MLTHRKPIHVTVSDSGLQYIMKVFDQLLSESVTGLMDHPIDTTEMIDGLDPIVHIGRFVLL